METEKQTIEGHSELPWAYHIEPGVGAMFDEASVVVNDHYEEWRADAEYIKVACNAYPALVAALEKIRANAIEAQRSPCPNLDLMATYEIAHDALKLATH